MRRIAACLAMAHALLAVSAGATEHRFVAQEIDPRVGNVCYAVTVADVNRDTKPDVIAVTETAVVWFENPTWRKRTIIDGQTERDNVCIAPHDIDGDGAVDFALGAGWQPTNTRTAGTLQWLQRGASLDEKWKVHAISSEPTLHRMRWGDVLGTGRLQLVVSPLQGRETRGPNWDVGNGIRLLVFSVPADPVADPWPSQVADETLHTMHNHWIVDFDGDGRNETLTASWHGVHLIRHSRDGKWTREQLAEGNQSTPPPQKGSSEIKLGRLSSGGRYLATIEPWHGFEAVVYTPPDKPGLWQRRLLDGTLKGGHAVWTAELDGDAADELIIGQRDQGAAPGVTIYDPQDAAGTQWSKSVLGEARVAVEDLVASDLDGDGRPEIIAGGRATHNVVILWNRTDRK